ncbi:MAG: hypothetical protein IPP32_08665 [Bacteroidetes bacterium]|nr:hypothetical protein [Bacteroidota bacterium]
MYTPEEIQNYFKSRTDSELSAELLTIFPKAFHAIIPLGKTDVSPRTFFHWKEKGLIPELASDDSESRKWVRLNLIEYLWVKFIQTLRDLGIGLSEIKKIKESLLVDPLKGILENLDSPSFLEFFRNFSFVRKENRDILIQTRKAFSTMPQSHKIFGTMFGGLIKEIYVNKDDISILIFSKKSEVQAVKSTKKPTQKEKIITKTELIITVEGKNANHLPKYIIDELTTLPHIKIPLKQLMIGYFEDESNLKHSSDFGIINKEEMALLECVRKNDFKEIIIKKDKGQLILEIVKEEDLKEEKLKELRKILGLKDYQKISITYRNDKHAYIENKVKKVL